MSANTVIHNTVIIAQFLRRQVGAIMTTQVQLPGAIRALPREYTEEDLTRYFDACDSFERAFFSAFLLTGVREQEMVYLFWSDMKFKLRTFASQPNHISASIQALEEAGDSDSPTTGGILREHPRRMGTEFVFPLPTGNREQNMLLRCKEVAARGA